MRGFFVIKVCYIYYNFLHRSTRKLAFLRSNSERELELSLKSNKTKAEQKQAELEEIKVKLMRVEEKWINNDVTRDTYERWYSQYTKEVSTLTNEIKRLKTNHQRSFQKLSGHLDKLTDMQYIYSSCSTDEKQNFIKLVTIYTMRMALIEHLQ